MKCLGSNECKQELRYLRAQADEALQAVEAAVASWRTEANRWDSQSRTISHGSGVRRLSNAVEILLTDNARSNLIRNIAAWQRASRSIGKSGFLYSIPRLPALLLLLFRPEIVGDPLDVLVAEHVLP